MATLRQEDGGQPLAAPEAEHSTRNLVALWFGLLGGPVIWFLGLAGEYALVEVACTKRSMFPLHLASSITLLVALSAAFAAFSQWNRLGRGWATEAGDPATRSRFMAVMGLILSVLFASTILAQWLGTAFLHPCMAI